MASRDGKIIILHIFISYMVYYNLLALHLRILVEPEVQIVIEDDAFFWVVNYLFPDMSFSFSFLTSQS